MLVQSPFGHPYAPSVNRFAGKKQVKPQKTTTPMGFTISVKPHPEKGKKAIVTINGQKAKLSGHMSSSWHYWYPHSDTPIGKQRLYWTKYIGTDQKFYNDGYRWGISLGGTPEELKKSALYKKGGLIDLPNGKYLIAIKMDNQGKPEVVIGKEDRGSHTRVLNAFHSGKNLDDIATVNQRKEVFGVSNHSMLISRGQPYAPDKAYEFSAIFAGEVEILGGRINAINDQTGQLFGPNGVINPPKPGQDPADGDKVMKQPTYELDKSASLKQARDILETITGKKGIRTIKVHFENDAPPPSEVRKSRTLELKAKSAVKLEEVLQETRIQQLFDDLQADPERQNRLIQHLGKHAQYRYAILDLKDALLERGTIKPEQGSKLAVELLETPEAIGLFLPESHYYIKGLSDNTKRKLIAAYNKRDPETRAPFNEVVLELKRNQPLVQFMVGQRVPGDSLDVNLSDFDQAGKLANLVGSLFNAALDEEPALPTQLEGTGALTLGDVGSSKQPIDAIATVAKRIGSDKVNVVFTRNPFYHVGLGKNNLRENLRILRQIQKDGVHFYTDPALENQNKALDYLTNLYAFAYVPGNQQDARLLADVKTIFQSYGVNMNELHEFTKKRFEKRWANNQIVAAYALKSKPFKRFLKDLNWFVQLPTASY